MRTEHWYIAVLVVCSQVEGSSASDPLVDLQLRLVRAADDEEAYRRAGELGAQEAHSYLNADGAQVSWRCQGLHDLRSLDTEELVHGFEVFSQLTRRSPTELVCAKAQLTCFWSGANKTARCASFLASDGLANQRLKPTAPDISAP